MVTLLASCGCGGPNSSGITAYTDIAGLYLWVEAQKDSFANNDPVGSMTDWSAQANTLIQATGAAKPTFLTGEVNSKPAFSFDGGDYVAKAAASGIGAGAFTFFTVIKRVGTGARRTILYAGDSTNAGRQILLDSSEKFRFTKSQIAEVAPSSANVSSTVYETWCLTFDGTTYTFYLNGTQDSTGSNAQSFTDTVPVIYVGANSGLGELANMKMAIGLMYNSVLSTTNRQNVETKIRADYATW